MDKLHIRYSVNGTTFAFMKGEVLSHALIGNLEIIQPDQYERAMNVVNSFNGMGFQIMPVLLIEVAKVMPDFDEKQLIGNEMNGVKYLWTWKDDHGNVWAETAFQSAAMAANQNKPELIN